VTELRATVRLYGGRWSADCPLCGSAEMWGRCQDGSVGGLDGAAFRCRDEAFYGGCGLRCAADWPPNVADIEAMTAARPPHARNWNPGETLADLLEENVMHGLVPTSGLDAAIEAGRSAPLLLIQGDRVVSGELASSGERLRIEA
jgi:hypothetical protein